MYIIHYDKKLVSDYIMGNDITDFTLEELEDNADFMREVIVKTDDPKMYYLCSDRLKFDLQFLQFVIERFIDSETIINNIVLEYFKNACDEIKRRELEIILGELSLKYKKSIYLKKYRNLIANTYIGEMNDFKSIISRVNSNQRRMYFGIGFFFVLDKYGSSKIIKDFYAKNIMEDILVNFDIERDLHSKFNDSYEVSNYGINTYILEKVNNYDIHLGNYLSANIHLMDEALKVIFVYLNRWNHYNSKFMRYILNKISSYLSENDAITTAFQKNVIKYIIDEMKNQLTINKNRNYQFQFKSLINSIQQYENNNKLAIPEIIALIEVEKIIRKEALNEEIINDNNKKLIKVNFSNTK